jgi:hypothetical protein
MDYTSKTKDINQVSTLSKRGDSNDLLGYIIVNSSGSVEVITVNHVHEKDFIRFRSGVKYLMNLNKKNLILSREDMTSSESTNIRLKTEDIQGLIKERSADINYHRICIKQLIQKECARPNDSSEEKNILEEVSIHIKIIQKHLEYLRDPDLLFREIENKQTTTHIDIKMYPGVSTKIDDKTEATWVPIRNSQCETTIVTVNTENSSSLVPIEVGQKYLTILHNTLNMYNTEYNYFDS